MVQLEQHGVHSVQRIHSSAGRPAETQGVHVDSKETERLILPSEGCVFNMDGIRKQLSHYHLLKAKFMRTITVE